MWILLVIVAFWFVAVLFTVALCATARRGEDVIARSEPGRAASEPAPEAAPELLRIAA